MVLFNEFQKEFPGSFILIEKNQPSSNKHALHISCDEIYPHNLQAPLIGTLTPSLTSNASPDLIVSRTTFLAFFMVDRIFFEILFSNQNDAQDSLDFNVFMFLGRYGD